MAIVQPPTAGDGDLEPSKKEIALGVVNHSKDFSLSEQTSAHTTSNFAETDKVRDNLQSLLAEGAVIDDQYIVRKKLGNGAMGTVYLVESDIPIIGIRKYVMKLVSGKYCDNPSAKLRFIREIQSVATVSHPNVVRAEYAKILGDGTVIFLTEYVDGGDLTQIVGTPLSATDVINYGKQIAAGVHAAHKANVIHRDLKPANILMTKDGVLKVADFGLAKYKDQDPQTNLTQDGSILGTPRYMAPETISLGSVASSEKSDVFSLGCILYELSTGRVPHFEALEGHEEGHTATFSLFNARQSTVPTDVNTARRKMNIDVADLPSPLAELISRMTSITPDARPTMQEVVQALDAMERGTDFSYSATLETVELRKSTQDTLQRVADPRSRTRAGIVAVLTLAVGALGVGGYSFSRNRGEGAGVETSKPIRQPTSVIDPATLSGTTLSSQKADSLPAKLDHQQLAPSSPSLPVTLMTVEEKDGVKVFRLSSGDESQGTAQFGSEWHHPNDPEKRVASVLFFSVDQYREYLGLSVDAPLPLETYGDGVDVFVYEFDDGCALHVDNKSQTMIYYSKGKKPIVYSHNDILKKSLGDSGRFIVSVEGVPGAIKNPDLYLSSKNWTMDPTEKPEQWVGTNNVRRVYTGPMIQLTDWLKSEAGKRYQANAGSAPSSVR